MLKRRIPCWLPKIWAIAFSFELIPFQSSFYLEKLFFFLFSKFCGSKKILNTQRMQFSATNTLIRIHFILKYSERKEEEYAKNLAFMNISKLSEIETKNTDKKFINDLFSLLKTYNSFTTDRGFRSNKSLNLLNLKKS